ncbi:MAG: thermonuclease family protein [Nitrospira sp.]|nr:thermonuclease family protein [Nitrospira sp.]MDH5253642.1 thermonuclease family protein [Nitrospira sp.]
MKPIKPWQNWISIDLVLLLIIVLCLIGLSIMAALIPIKSHAAACLTIDVPPGAVVNQPDGDTFHVFAFQPGGVVKIRVEGIDTPERKQPGWAEAKAFTKAWLTQGPFKVTTCGKPTIDRIVGRVERDGTALADALKAAGLGR